MTFPWKPKPCRPGHFPLPTMAVSAESKIDVMMVLELVMDAWCVGEEHRKSFLWGIGETGKVGSSRTGVVEAYDTQFPSLQGYEGDLIHQQDNFMTVGHLKKLGKRHSAEMVVVP